MILRDLKRETKKKFKRLVIIEYPGFILIISLENIWYPNGERAKKANELKQLHAFQIKLRWKKESLRCFAFVKKGRSEISQND